MEAIRFFFGCNGGKMETETGIGWRTWSGYPAFSPEQREYYERRRREIAYKLREYLHSPDFYSLPIPFVTESFDEFRKRDVRMAWCNPVHLLLTCSEVSRKEERAHRYELECGLAAGFVSKEDYDEMNADLEQRKARRLADLRGMVQE